MINSASEYEPDILDIERGFKNSKFYKECMSSLALSPPKNFVVFEGRYLVEYYTLRAKMLTIS